ncbi:MAG TPA: aminoglycoside phosphotransferase family protein [Acidimicrobiales bacterium]|nr:aminoglycoside phosphotransferase family protein [Acidimicrobiales bacterium]
MTSAAEVLAAADHFTLEGRPPTSVCRLEGGHIHETWLVEGAGPKYVVQRLNSAIFGDLDAMMTNLLVVTEALDLPNRPVETPGGAFRWNEWRAFPYLEGTHRPGPAPSLDVVEEIGRAFGEFHCRAATIDPDRLAVTLPGFHDLSGRLRTLDRVVAEDPVGRGADVAPELAAVRRRRSLSTASESIDPPNVPRRVAHFDAKPDNVLLDNETGRVRAIVDLDTVMAGSVLWDVGDLARSLSTTEPEDAVDAGRVRFLDARFDALVRGYRREADRLLNPAEQAGLTVAPVIVTFEQAVRFLADHLAGDRYYRVTRAGHNLERARTQLALVESMLAAGLGPGQ